MNTLQRMYADADTDMLVAAAAIMDKAIENKDFLIAKRSVWQDPFFSEIRNNIDQVIKQYLGIDGAKALRKSTSLVVQNMKMANTLLAEVKVQIEQDFKNEPDQRDEILRQLGFFDNFKQAKNGNQEVMLKLLTTFKTNVDGETGQIIIKKGIAPESIKQITMLADELQKTEIKQEGQKSDRVAITEDGIKAFNDIYSKVISICKIASKFYKDESLLKQQFTFSKVIASLSLQSSKTAPEKTKNRE